MKSRKDLKEIAKRDAKRFCNRNRVYETYDGSVADMIKKLYITTYLRARHQIMSEINQQRCTKDLKSESEENKVQLGEKTLLDFLDIL